MKYFSNAICIIITATLIASSFSAIAQTDHEKHHPKQNSSGSTMTPGGIASDSGKGISGGMGGGGMGNMMGGGMGDMMKEMGKTPAKGFYPTLMQLPDLSPEKHDEIQQLANQQVLQGNALIAIGLDQLSAATRRQDMDEMQEANEQIQRGQILLESGLEGQRALVENTDPRVTALQWYNREMNLPTYQDKQSQEFSGISWFHYVVMLMLAAFIGTVIWMYFHKMQRANALISKLAGNSTEKIPSPVSSKNINITTSISSPKTQVANSSKPAVTNQDMEPSKPNSWKGTLLVSEIFDETPTVKTFRLTDPTGGKLPFNFLPGQFITVTVIPNGIPILRSYTIASSPTHRDYCEITVKHEDHGSVSHYLNTQVHEGELLQLTAPSGKFTFTGTEADSIVLIGGGVGVTPLMSVIRYLTDHSWKKDMYLFFLCKTEKSIIFKEEIMYLQKRYPNLHVFFILSRPEEGTSNMYMIGHITKEIIEKCVPEIINRRIHICGPETMMDAVKQMLNELHVPKGNVKTELFDTVPPIPPVSIVIAEPEKTDITPAPKEDSTATNSSVPPPEEKDKAPPSDSVNTSGSVVATFAKSNVTAVLTPGKSILEASEESGVNIDYQCRVGTCGICKTTLISGQVTMAVEDALTEEDKAQNIILACQAKATEDVTVDA